MNTFSVTYFARSSVMSSGKGLLYGLGKVMVGKVMVGKVMVEVCVRVDHCYGQYTLQTISFV